MSIKTCFSPTSRQLRVNDETLAKMLPDEIADIEKFLSHAKEKLAQRDYKRTLQLLNCIKYSDFIHPELWK